MGQRMVLLVATIALITSAFLAAPAEAVRGAVASGPPAESGRMSTSVTERVSYAPPRAIRFVGPARFAGVSFSDGGATVTVRKRFGTIVPVTASIDRSKVVNGVRYGRLVDGPLASTWVRVNESVTRAIGKAPRPPTCRYDDILTSRRSPSKHAITLLDTIYMVGRSYEPTDLRDTGEYGLNSGYKVRAVIGADLRAMARAARSNGTPIQIVSGYRSYATQEATFNYWVSVGGYEQALLTSARPGHSEHQLGTAIDVTSKGGSAPWNYSDWATTPAGAWMKKNAWRHGFLMSYPRDRTSVSCYAYEPWHFRYVGRPIAEAVRRSGLTLREAIWAAYGP